MYGSACATRRRKGDLLHCVVESMEDIRNRRDKRKLTLVDSGAIYNTITACFKLPDGRRISMAKLVYSTEEQWLTFIKTL